ncbi:UNVERIFIED_CONTAM: Beta-glucosidase 12 [Sesamum angustifolium]|uniref:Beta-glucosidase 12 n=1 Tax=Sesamum angustifolium TaxID=2727405 RepID=A0AAW2KDL0_9LAMI
MTTQVDLSKASPGLYNGASNEALWHLKTSKAMAALQVVLFLICSSFASAVFAATNDTSPNFNRTIFPESFVFGASSSAYQYEGAASEGGRGPSIWDTYTHQFPERIADHSTGDVAVDFYHRYKEDVKFIKDIGLDAFRMSISWSRVLPRITPFVTIFHWDVPQGLEDEYLGFLSPRIIDDYKDFAELCFKEFGDRVKHWATLNEPYIFSSGGYDGGLTGNAAPGRCSNRSIVPKGIQQLSLILLVIICFLPMQQLSNYTGTNISRLDVRAAERALDFMYGWFINPIVYGDYPRTMRSIVGDRLPNFTKEEEALVKGSIDYVGLNYYTGNFARNLWPMVYPSANL